MYRKKHGHHKDSDNDQYIIDNIVCSSGHGQQKGQLHPNKGSRDQTDQGQRFEPLHKKGQDNFGLAVKPVRQHTVVTIHKQGLGHTPPRMNQIHNKEEQWKHVHHHLIHLGSYVSVKGAGLPPRQKSSP